MKLDFVKLSPTQNMTLLVTSPVPRRLHCSVAGQLMAYDGIHAEQVGFLEEPTLPGALARLQMMGGEFCGNATMSLAAFLAFQEDLPDDAEKVYPLEISGAEGIVSCNIRREGRAYWGTISMPLPTRICEMDLGGIRCPVVFLPGIAHAIIPAQQMTRTEAEAQIAGWCASTNQEAFGIILRHENSISPLVYVRETDSAVWERGCGSGTAALGAYEAFINRASVDLRISQPGGVIRVKAQFKEQLQSIEITGLVKIAAMGQTWAD